MPILPSRIGVLMEPSQENPLEPRRLIIPVVPEDRKVQPHWGVGLLSGIRFALYPPSPWLWLIGSGLLAVALVLINSWPSVEISRPRVHQQGVECGDPAEAFAVLKAAAIEQTEGQIIGAGRYPDPGTFVSILPDCRIAFVSSNLVRLWSGAIISDTYSGSVIRDPSSGRWHIDELNFANAVD